MVRVPWNPTNSDDFIGAVADIKSSNNEGRRPELFEEFDDFIGAAVAYIKCGFCVASSGRSAKLAFTSPGNDRKEGGVRGTLVPRSSP